MLTASAAIGATLSRTTTPNGDVLRAEREGGERLATALPTWPLTTTS
jgi:hypothetical protein